MRMWFAPPIGDEDPLFTRVLAGGAVGESRRCPRALSMLGSVGCMMAESNEATVLRGRSFWVPALGDISPLPNSCILLLMIYRTLNRRFDGAKKQPR